MFKKFDICGFFLRSFLSFILLFLYLSSASYAIDGAPFWAKDGEPISTAEGGNWQLSSYRIAGDSGGNAFVAWVEKRTGENYNKVFVQRISNAGAVGGNSWFLNGKNVCWFDYDLWGQSGPEIVGDGSGGAIVAWVDSRAIDYPGMGTTGADIYAQKFNSDGDIQWPATGATQLDGISVCAASGNQGGIEIIGDGAGGAIIAWTN